jgi:hypothetical protein
MYVCMYIPDLDSALIRANVPFNCLIYILHPRPHPTSLTTSWVDVPNDIMLRRWQCHQHRRSCDRRSVGRVTRFIFGTRSNVDDVYVTLPDGRRSCVHDVRDKLSSVILWYLSLNGMLWAGKSSMTRGEEQNKVCVIKIVPQIKYQ